MKKKDKNKKRLKIVVLTNPESLYGKIILNQLSLDGQRADTVVLIKQPVGYYIKLFKNVFKRVGLIDAIYFAIIRFVHDGTKRRPVGWEGKFINDYTKLAKSLCWTRGSNSVETLKKLKNISPDVIILGQTGIIRMPLIKIAKIGILNGHPGYLPYYRGIDCEKWAIYRKDFNTIGYSVHWVNGGVDTGNIIKVKLYQLTKGDKFKDLEEKMFVNCAKLLSNVVKNMSLPTLVKSRSQDLNIGKQYYKMTRKMEFTAKANLINYLRSLKDA